MIRPAPIIATFLFCSGMIGCGISGGAIIGGTFANTGSDVVTRFFHHATLMPDGKVMVTGGMTLQFFPPSLISLKTISFYDPASGIFTSSFTPTGGGAAVAPLLLTARSSHTQTTLPDGRVLITGGNTGAAGTNPGTAINTVEIFSPSTGVVSSLPPMAAARAGHSATLISGARVVIAGFFNWQIFDSNTNTWSPANPLIHSRIDHAAVRLPEFFGPSQDGVLLVAGGGSGGDTMEVLNPATGSSTALSSTLTIPVDDVSATMLDNGEVLIAGGQNLNDGNTILNAYRLDPVADTLVSIPSPPNIPDGIADHAAVALGRYVAIFGGESQVSNVDTELSYAAIYDRLANTWIYQGSMLHAHDDFPAVLLNDGSILLIGGGAHFLGNEAPTANAEIFSPTNVIPGDLNNDGDVNELDIPMFNAVILNPASATNVQFCAGDVNVDLQLDGLDVQGFVDLLLGA
jgi:hypothetical protein